MYSSGFLSDPNLPVIGIKQTNDNHPWYIIYVMGINKLPAYMISQTLTENTCFFEGNVKRF